MSTEAPRQPSRANFLLTLLRRGAPAVATAPTELSDEVADPTPMRALRRIQHMAGPVDAAARDGLLLRAARYVALVPLVYRILAVPGALSVFLAAGHGGTAPVVAVAVCSVLLNVFGGAWLLRAAPFRGDHAARLLIADVGFTVVANLVVAAAVPPPAFADAMLVPGKHLLGAIALLTLALGVPYGFALLALSIPLRGAMFWLNTGRFDVAGAFSGFGTMLGVLFTAAGALALIGLGTRLALAYGIRNGRLAERAQQHRRLHDTVLQTLETLALPGTGDAERQLVELRRMARAQAVELRQTIESAAAGAAEAGSRPLGEKLAALVAEMALDGLRAQLVIAELDHDTLSEVRQIALRDAVREALRNTVKHAGTDQVVVRVEERGDGIAAIVRDHGHGFSEDSRPAGFGISESITARLAEVGGTARVESAPGSGTRVTLWVPCWANGSPGR
ncbi:sensor histidine kinase [Amycolatopsis anabasis]|uniref:sensor histidine kinase n=1 Tax=Amycolatopsis anabasis TaxID=1840409 RepID=UPI00131DFE34|nr:ATP-binding protein [Amycolatopsis anabasis]